MKVLLIQDVDNLGDAGEVQEVADGYGRNYLIPQGLAVLATPGALKDADLHRRRAAERRKRIAEELATLSEAIRQTTLTFKAKAGEKGRLYGSVTAAEIADELAQAVNHEIDRRKIVMEGPIKRLGTHKVTIRISGELTSQFEVIVESTEAPEEGEEEGVSVEEAPVEE